VFVAEAEADAWEAGIYYIIAVDPPLAKELL
jgi:hypothetical protein